MRLGEAEVDARLLDHLVPAPDATGRVFVSKLKGILFSAAKLKPLGENDEYQLWLLTKGAPVNVGTMRANADGNITAVHANIIPDTKSGTPGADSVKVKGNIHWVSAPHAYEAEVRLYDRLFSDPHPDAGGKDFKASLNPDSVKVVTAYVEPSLAQAQPDQKFQFERFGYFVADRHDHVPGQPVFNKITGLKDGHWK